jgi:hypothetical protein
MRIVANRKMPEAVAQTLLSKRLEKHTGNVRRRSNGVLRRMGLLRLSNPFRTLDPDVAGIPAVLCQRAFLVRLFTS